ncbi:MAG: MoaD/ThiS family protein [Armatimonadota bacterium]
MAAITVRLPHSLRQLAGGRSSVRANGATVGAAISDLISQHPALRPRLRDSGGKLRSWVVFFLNDEDIRTREGELTPVADGDTLALVAVAEGG